MEQSATLSLESTSACGYVLDTHIVSGAVIDW